MLKEYLKKFRKQFAAWTSCVIPKVSARRLSGEILIGLSALFLMKLLKQFMYKVHGGILGRACRWMIEDIRNSCRIFWNNSCKIIRRNLSLKFLRIPRETFVVNFWKNLWKKPLEFLEVFLEKFLNISKTNLFKVWCINSCRSPWPSFWQYSWKWRNFLGNF